MKHSHLTTQDNQTGNSCQLEGIFLKETSFNKYLFVGEYNFHISYINIIGNCTDTQGNIFILDDVKGIIEEKNSLW